MPSPRPLGPDDPRRLGEYTLLGRIDKGVYLARDETGTRVSLRVQRGEPGPRARARVTAEAEAVREVTAPALVPVLDAGVRGGQAYVVSEHVDAPSLQAAVAKDGPLTGTELRRLAMRSAAGLAALHRAGIVHGDVRPGNLLLGPGGPRLTGFGPCRPQEAQAAYLAPEQIEDEPTGPPADVFAWGSAVVYAATGRPPFGLTPGPAVARRVVARAPDLGDLQSPLRELVTLALDKNPQARPTAPQIVRTLRGQPAARPKPRRIPAYRRRMMIAVGAVIVLGFVVGMLLPT